MTKRTIVAIIVILVILGLVILWQSTRGKKTAADLILSVSGRNETKNANAAEVTAKPNDVIEYTLTVENPNDQTINGFVIETNITDIGELATLTDAAGANYNPATGSLVWTPLDVPAKESIQRKFKARIKTDLPVSSDMVMRVKFNNELAVNVSRNQVAGNSTNNPSPTPTPSSAGSGNVGGESFNSPETGPSGMLSVVLAGGLTLFALLSRKKNVFVKKEA